MDEQELKWKLEFNTFCSESLLSSKTSLVITEANDYEILSYLQGGSWQEGKSKEEVSQLRFKWKKKQYRQMILPNNQTLLIVPDQRSGYRIVVPVERFSDTLKGLHEATGHAGTKAMEEKIKEQYYGIPRSAVKQFLRGCLTCGMKASQLNHAKPSPIVETKLFSRVQVDLIDLSHKPSDDYKYVVHLMDHFSRFHILEPVTRKSSANVNAALQRMFGMIGPARLLQTDNGGEFAHIDEVFTDWPGSTDVTIIHGRPRHPQSQGLVERGNKLIEDKITAAEMEWRRKYDGPFKWHVHLPVIQYQANISYCRSIRNTPYEVVYGIKPKVSSPFGQPSNVNHESEDPIIEMEEISQPIIEESDNDRPTPTNIDEMKNASLGDDEDHDIVDNRHNSIRTKAAQAAKNAALERAKPKKYRPTQLIDEGQAVTVAIPKIDRKNTDIRRLPAIVVQITGNERKLFKLRCQFGYLDKCLRDDSIQKFNGELNTTTWADGSISLRRAAALLQQSVQTSCRCKANCSTNKCPCRKKNRNCSPACHKGKMCLNRVLNEMDNQTAALPQETEQQDTVTHEDVQQQNDLFSPNFFAEMLHGTNFAEDTCAMFLEMAQNLSTNLLAAIRQAITEPTVPTIAPNLRHEKELNAYGSGYTSFLPAQLLKTHRVLTSGSDGNRCLYNATSKLLYGNEHHAAFLKMMTALHGATIIPLLIDEVLFEHNSPEEILNWSASFTQSVDFSNDPRAMVTEIVTKEVQKTLTDDDSGPVQLMALANYLQATIEVSCLQKELTRTFGTKDRKIKIVLVPSSSESTNIRYNHFVPATERSDEDGCLAQSFHRCQGGESPMISCHSCYRKLHVACASYESLMDIQLGEFKCGCTRKAPFAPNRKTLKFLTDMAYCKEKLHDRKEGIKKVILSMLKRQGYRCWRKTKYFHKKSRPELLSQSCMGIPEENIVLTWIVTMLEGCQKIETEFMLADSLNTTRKARDFSNSENDC